MSKITPEILARFFEGKTTSEENNLIADWIEKDSDNQEIFNKELQMHMVIMHEQVSGRTRSDLARKHLMRFAKYASVAASFAVGILLTWFLAVVPLRNEASKIVSFHTNPGQRSSLTLPDGTTVELNSGSTLEYPAVFARNERRVRLEGEAMFDVAGNSDKPFYVETFAYDIKVLGTKFNVESCEGNGIFSTALMAGKVTILDKNNRIQTKLEPNNMVTLSENGLVKVYVEDIISHYRWTEGIINCEGLSFENLMKKFEKAFGVNIVIECETVPDISYKRMKVNICDGILHAFSLLQRSTEFNIRFDEVTNTYFVE